MAGRSHWNLLSLLCMCSVVIRVRWTRLLVIRPIFVQSMSKYVSCFDLPFHRCSSTSAYSLKRTGLISLAGLRFSFRLQRRARNSRCYNSSCQATGNTIRRQGIARHRFPFVKCFKLKLCIVDVCAKINVLRVMLWGVAASYSDFQPLNRISAQLTRQIERLQGIHSTTLSGNLVCRTGNSTPVINNATRNHARTLQAIGICVSIIFQYQSKFYLTLRNWSKLCNG